MIVPYEKITPSATYAPWLKDSDFLECYELINSNTLVDIYRCYELWKLVEQSAKLPGGRLLEVGVWKGGTGALIATQAQRQGLNSKVYLCDTFSGVVKAGPNDSSYKGGEHADARAIPVECWMREKLALSNIIILEGVFPDHIGSLLTSSTFRFCHIDVDTYQSSKDVFDWVWDRMVPGGIVVFDDYGFEQCDGVTKCVEELAGSQDRVFIHNLCGHGIFVKLY